MLAFGARSWLDDPHPLAGLARAFPQSVPMGCSSAGEIAASQVSDSSISVVVAQFERTTLACASTPIRDAADSEAAGRRLAAQLPAAGLRAVFLLA